MTAAWWPMLAGATEFSLEASGAILAARRRTPLLPFLLGFRALMDVASLFLHGNAYGWAWWAGQVGQLAMLTLLCCQIAAKMLKDYRPVNGYAWGMGILVAFLTVLAWVNGDSLLHKWLDAQIAATMALSAVLLA